MQVLPRTAKEMGFRNMKNPPAGIHAGVKYLDVMQDRGPQELDASNRVFFALASYNAGAGHVRDARTLARQTDRNPNLWFGNVEDAMRLLSKPDMPGGRNAGSCAARSRSITCGKSSPVTGLTWIWSSSRNPRGKIALNQRRGDYSSAT